ncbi:USP [Symbiodinium sp. CCMP2592]|nr:USP [Symbiodinium sp. CCMP2592]
MQDYAKLLPPEAKVGFTRYPLEFGYFPCKNDIATAARLAADGTPPHGAASAENAVYHANCVQLRLLGASVAPARERHWRGGPQLMGPAVVLWPDFAPSLAELRKKLPAPDRRICMDVRELYTFIREHAWNLTCMDPDPEYISESWSRFFPKQLQSERIVILRSLCQ